MTCSKSQIYAQLSNVQLVLSAQDSSIEHVYGPIHVKVNPSGLDDTTSMLLVRKSNYIRVKFPGLDWIEYSNKLGNSSDHSSYIEWSKRGCMNYAIDLSYFYFNNPALVDSFIPIGGQIQIKFTGTFRNTTEDSTYYWTSNILSFNIPPANTEELQAFKYLLSQEKTYSGTHLDEIFIPEVDFSTQASEKHYKYLIEHFPNTLVGAMAKCRLAYYYCFLHRNKIIPPNLKQQINEFYQTLKAHPSKYIRRQAEVLIKCHD
jgi:hypothetical protein